jgi:hypothetical protein
MSVEKFKPTIENECIPYAQIRQEVIDNITNLEAGFVWIYLISKPSSWQVIKEHLKHKFGIGDKKLKVIFAYLRKCNLIEYIQTKDEKGSFGKSNIRILNGSRFVSYPQEKPAGSIWVPPGLGTSGKEGLVINNKQQEVTKQREAERPKSPPKPARQKREPLSADFHPDEKRLLLAKETSLRVGLPVDKLLRKFHLVQSSSTRPSADWQAELEKFLMTERAPFPGNPSTANPKPQYRGVQEPNRPSYRDFTQERIDRERQEARDKN